MWFHSSIDVAVYSVLAAVSLYPVALPLLRKIRLPALPAGAPAPDRWQSGSVATLIALQGELDARKMPAATKLCRELIWEILGGDTP
jgi:hypothetical protein